ncbi:MAG: 23S rRNA pseudouridine(1911/1915/1917) synthase RluD [Proteobacteria bacterium]|nr:23S rRNA pseudouridine(1911/1915/1917) synthase RluD [Pseudomonadota bacterium]
MQNQIKLQSSLPEDYKGMRLDQALAHVFPEHSRTRITQWIRSGQVSVDGHQLEPKAKVNGGEQVTIHASVLAQLEEQPEDIALDIIYEDETLLVINKPAGLVVHPAAGNRQGTLLNALLHHAPSLSLLPRAGIVHRLDKDTTGLMVVAKTLTAHTALVAALQRREIAREYVALVGHEVIAGGTIDEPIGRHPQQRTKMAVTHNGKPARTHFRCLKRYHGFTLLDVKLETGRTHQIRVHLSHRGYPIVGDATYGWRYRVPAKSTPELQQALMAFRRQALHAKTLSLQHPVTLQTLSWQAPIPADFAALLKLLQAKEGYYCERDPA